MRVQYYCITRITLLIINSIHNTYPRALGFRAHVCRSARALRVTPRVVSVAENPRCSLYSYPYGSSAQHITNANESFDIKFVNIFE